MMEPHEGLRPEEGRSDANGSTFGLLPRPCSMPSFDRNADAVGKKNMQTLPPKCSAKKGLAFKPWKSMSSSQGLFGHASPAFGTPSYPSHLDMIRVNEPGLSTSDISNYSSHEMNNNFLDPVIHEAKYGNYDFSQREEDLSSSKKNLGESLHSFSFAPGFSRGTFAASPSPGLNSSLNASWQFFNFVGGADVGTVFPTTTRNPNKAIITIDGKTSKILVANEIAGKLFGYLNDELTGMKMSKLFTMKDGFKQDALLEQHIDTEGNIVMVSGKVVEAVDRDDNIMPVSLWMKRITSDGDPRCVAIIEPVQRAIGSFLFNAEGTIIDCDSFFAAFHGYTNPEEIVGMSILHLIPAFMLPIPGQEIGKSTKKQTATGKTVDNTRFPVSIQISEYDKDFHELYLRRGHPDEIQFSKFLYKGVVWVFSNISGLVSVLPNGQIHSCNGNFSMMLFGYSEQELVGKDLTSLIPLFYDHVELAEDRSLKIPSISDDGEIQLDPKRDTAMSGHFGIGVSSQSECYSDIDSLLDNSEYMRDLKGETHNDNSCSDHTATSSLTIGSEKPEGIATDSRSINDSSTSEGSYLTPRGADMHETSGQQCSEDQTENALKPSAANETVATKDSISESSTKQSSIREGSNMNLKGAASPKSSTPESSRSETERNMKSPPSESSRRDRTTGKLREPKSTIAMKNGKHSRGDLNALSVSGTSLNLSSPNLVDLSVRGSSISSLGANEGYLSENTPQSKASDRSAMTEQQGNSRVMAEGSTTELKTSKYTIMERKVSSERNCSHSETQILNEPTDCANKSRDSITNSSPAKDIENIDRIHELTNGESNDQSQFTVSDLSKKDEDREEQTCFGNEQSVTDKTVPYGQHSAEEESPTTTEYRGLPTTLRYNSDIGKSVPGSLSSDDTYGKRGNEFVTKQGHVVTDQTDSDRMEQSYNERETVTRKVIDDSWQASQITSTPKLDRSDSHSKKILEGNFCGQAKHRDGSLLPIIFQIKQITLDKGQEMYCIWVSRDPEEQGEGSRMANQMLLAGSFNSTLNMSNGYFSDAMKGVADLNRSLTEENYKGKYDERYLTLKSIGKGAFGFVKLAQRRSDAREVVVKFIQKSKIVPSSWIEDQRLGNVPLEVYYLSKLDHPNIVKMFDVFENDDFFQLVMEKHGDGIDLFEFIDRQPALDEPLCAYMFRQVVSAVSYLHNENILHRDVKDENIIVDKTFSLKLIDFGSAVFMEKGKLFSTFCGTVEYCSPEVLLGNKYRGPELEVWSMGITLYTLVFGENPFFDVEETIKAELHPPFRVSSELMFLICWMLHAEPDLRSTIKDIEKYKWLNQKVDIRAYNYDSLFDEDREEYLTGLEAASNSPADYDDNYENYVEHYSNEDEEQYANYAEHFVDHVEYAEHFVDHEEYAEHDHEEFVREHEHLEEEYMRYLQRQSSFPEVYERAHGASF